jgi:broad specificity phosphatase PhoE
MTGLRLLLIRHGESVANSEGRMQGRLDSPLNACGVRQAGATAERLAGEGRPEALYTSPLQRALDTARILGERLGLEPIVLPDLMEVDIGEAQGLPWTEFEARWPKEARALRGSGHDARWPGGESRTELAARAARAMDEIVARHATGTVAVVGHGGTLRWGLMHLLCVPDPRSTPYRFDNCALSEVLLTPGECHLVRFNDASHLASADAEEDYTHESRSAPTEGAAGKDAVPTPYQASADAR